MKNRSGAISNLEFDTSSKPMKKAIVNTRVKSVERMPMMKNARMRHLNSVRPVIDEKHQEDHVIREKRKKK